MTSKIKNMKKIFKNNRFIIILVIFVLLSLLWSWFFNISFARWVEFINSNSYERNNSWIWKEKIEKLFETYLEEKNDNSDRWLTFMSILSTLFAVFFVYSSFKIDRDLKEMNWKINELDEKAYELLEKLNNAYNEKIKALNKRTEEEKDEINQKNEEEKEELKRENNFIKMINYYSKEITEEWEYEDIIEGLNSLLKDDYILKENDKYNTVIYYLSKAYYWKWFKEWEKKENIMDLSQAIIFANEAIEDPNDPYKSMLIDRFNDISKDTQV